MRQGHRIRDLRSVPTSLKKITSLVYSAFFPVRPERDVTQQANDSREYTAESKKENKAGGKNASGWLLCLLVLLSYIRITQYTTRLLARSNRRVFSNL